jgi:hypothetical protein
VARNRARAGRDGLAQARGGRPARRGLIRRGYVVLDASYWPYRAGEDHDVASVTKSLVGAMIGHLAIDPDERVVDRFPEVARLDEAKRSMRVRDLLTMRAGLENDEERDLWDMFASEDWVRHTLDRPMAAAPGTRFNYTSGVSHVLSRIRHDAEKGASPALLRKLGIDIASWPTDPQGVPYGGGDMHLEPRDLAKLGLLYLRGGRWKDEQLLDAAWVEAATRPQAAVPDDPVLDYGYHWWTIDGGFIAVGRGGQYLAVIPEADLIVVALGGAARGSGKEFERLLREHILGAILWWPRTPDTPAPIVRTVGAPPAAKAPAALPPLAAQVSGVRWEIDTNDRYEPKAFTLDFSKRTITIERSEATAFAFGLDGRPRLTPRPPGPRRDPRALDRPSALHGRWTDERTFVLEWDEINNINRWTITFRFDGDSVRIRYDEATFLPPRERIARRG